MELLLDPNIRGWVFLPIVVITFLVGIVRHYIAMLLSSQKKVELQQLQDRYKYLLSTSTKNHSHLCKLYILSILNYIST